MFIRRLCRSCPVKQGGRARRAELSFCSAVERLAPAHTSSDFPKHVNALHVFRMYRSIQIDPKADGIHNCSPNQAGFHQHCLGLCQETYGLFSQQSIEQLTKWWVSRLQMVSSLRSRGRCCFSCHGRRLRPPQILTATHHTLIPKSQTPHHKPRTPNPNPKFQPQDVPQDGTYYQDPVAPRYTSRIPSPVAPRYTSRIPSPRKTQSLNPRPKEKLNPKPKQNQNLNPKRT